MPRPSRAPARCPRLPGVRSAAPRRGPYILKPADTARLWRTAGVAAGARGWIENNLGLTDDARTSLAEAHRRGELIEDDQLIAWARYMQATVEDSAGNPQGARKFTLDGITHTRMNSPQRAILKMDTLAGSYVALGDKDNVRRAIEGAQEILSVLSTDQVITAGRWTILDSMTSVSRDHPPTAGGWAFARVGLPGEYVTLTSSADHTGTHVAKYRANEAVAAAREVDPDPDHARALASEALALATPYETAHVYRRMQDVATATKGTTAGRDLVEEVRTWRAARTAQMPSVEA